jgi:hypothetical protein
MLLAGVGVAALSLAALALLTAQGTIDFQRFPSEDKVFWGGGDNDLLQM